MDARTLGLILLVAAGVLALIGLALMAGLLSWFGRLPGDLRFGSDNVRVYVPIVSMLLLSLLASIALALISRLR